MVNVKYTLAKSLKYKCDMDITVIYWQKYDYSNAHKIDFSKATFKTNA